MNAKEPVLSCPKCVYPKTEQYHPEPDFEDIEDNRFSTLKEITESVTNYTQRHGLEATIAAFKFVVFVLLFVIRKLRKEIVELKTENALLKASSQRQNRDTEQTQRKSPKSTKRVTSVVAKKGFSKAGMKLYTQSLLNKKYIYLKKHVPQQKKENASAGHRTSSGRERKVTHKYDDFVVDKDTPILLGR